jgi:uncharacterized membrane protein
MLPPDASTGRAIENIDAILRLEKQDEERLGIHHRVFHAIGSFVGTVPFIMLQCVAVACWVALNGSFPRYAVDTFPFPLLATLLALEAVFLTSCVLIRQNVTDRILEKRDHLELQINLLAEREATRSLRILQKVAKRLNLDDEDCQYDELAHETSVNQIARDLRDREHSDERLG